jgi:hypothetical protein
VDVFRAVGPAWERPIVVGDGRVCAHREDLFQLPATLSRVSTSLVGVLRLTPSECGRPDAI